MGGECRRLLLRWQVRSGFSPKDDWRSGRSSQKKSRRSTILPPRMWKRLTASISFSKWKPKTSASLSSAVAMRCLSLSLMHRDDLVAEAGGELELHVLGGGFHAGGEEFLKLVGAAVKEELHVADGLLVDLGGGEVLHAGTEAPLDIELQAGARMVAGEIDLAGRNQEGAVDEVDKTMGEVAGKVRAEVLAAILAELAGDEDLGKSVAHGEFDVGVGLVVAKERMLKRGLRCLMRLFSRARASRSLSTTM